MAELENEVNFDELDEQLNETDGGATAEANEDDANAGAGQEEGDEDDGETPTLEELKAQVEAYSKESDEDAQKLKQIQEAARRQYSTSNDDEASGESREEVDARSIYVGNVEYAATEEEIQALFKDCGVVKRIKIMRDKFTGHPKGFCYVEFAEPNAVPLAMALDESMFHGRQIKVKSKRTNLPGLARGRGRGRGRSRGRGRGYRGGYRGRGNRGGMAVYFAPVSY